MPDTKIPEYLLLWLAPLVVIALARSRGKMAGTGLVVAYLVQLGLLHWVAPVLYTLPWYHGNDPRVVEAFVQAVKRGDIQIEEQVRGAA